MSTDDRQHYDEQERDHRAMLAAVAKAKEHAEAALPQSFLYYLTGSRK